ncbi:MAG: SusC/RagA family TonB-linked outer membrane protein [Mesonia sp.]|uniref:SusC/RagA family TonB-linked outer membrane protein n=1 Tax=Mesonia sp. TaxID=1960830 RepID=UPI003F9E5B7C
MRTKFSGILTLLLAFVVQITFAQEKTVSGTVTDDQGLPLPGVNIIIKGTSSGTQTDFDGIYNLEASNGSTLVFSYIGFETQEVTVGAASSYDVTMEAGNTLDEVVVTSFGIKRQKKQLSYQSEEVDAEQLNVVQPQNVAQGLTGKVAGLQINTTNNGVNPGTKIVLRGLRSISGNSTALVVIDGSIASEGAFNALNPNDVESVNILKGATAAVLYGSDAANGALVVTTKKGSTEKFKVAINSTTTFQEIAYMPEFQSEYGIGWQTQYERIENTNWGPRFDGVVRPIGPTLLDGSFQSVPYAPVQDNLKNFYDTGVTLQNTVSISGGDDTSSFYLSIGEQDTKGIVPGDKYNRNTFRFNGSKTLGDLTLSVNTSYFRDDTSVSGQQIGAQDRPLYWFILNTPNNIPLSNYRDWRNNKFANPDGYYNGYYENPFWAVDNNRDNDKSGRFTSNISAEWQANEWLSFTGRMGINTLSTIGKEYRNGLSFNDDITYSRPNASTSFVTDYERQYLQYTSTFIANGEFDLSDSFSLDALLGATNFTSEDRRSQITANNLSVDGFYDISNSAGQLQAVVNEDTYRTYGYLGQLNFGYNDYLFLDVSGRYDYTSSLPSDENSYFYPGVGLSFIATDAIPSIKGNVLNYLKITANNSTVYNDLKPYEAVENYLQPAYFPFANTNGFTIQGTAVDSDIKKEKINTTEFGANFAFLKNRLTLDASVFKTTTTDLLTQVTPSVASAATAILTNIGELEGKGVELTLGAKILSFPESDFSWDASINFSAYETVVNEVSDQTDEAIVQAFTDGGIYASVGEAFPQIKGNSYVRDDQGSIIVDENTGNPIIGDPVSLGKTTPDYIIGLTSNVRYKGFTLSTTWDYRTGHVYYSQLGHQLEFTGRSMASVSSNRQDFVIPNSVYQNGTDANGNPQYVTNTNIPITGGRQNYWTNHYNNIAENYVKDATAVKLRELAIRYSVPSDFLKNTPLNKVSLGVVGTNLLTWLPKENRYADPEFNNNTANSNAVGLGGYFQTPPTRTYGFNINVEF